MTAKPVPEHISDEIDALAQEIRRVDGENRLGAGALAEALQPFLTELQHRREAGSLAQDVVDLVIAARVVAYEDQSTEAIRALDKAAEAFAERVGWENDPDDEALSALGEHP
jgi:hypothetical protein